MSFGSRRIYLAGSSDVEAIALFRYKIVLVPDFAWLVYRWNMYVHSSAAYRDVQVKWCINTYVPKVLFTPVCAQGGGIHLDPVIFEYFSVGI